MKTKQQKKAQEILNNYFDNTLGSRLNAKLGAKIAVELILSAIEQIEDYGKDLAESELAEHYSFWFEVEKIIEKSN